VILGTAGSGKTTMAILRSAYLSDPDLPQHGRTLLLTYNKALGAYIRALAAPQLQKVTVEHYHKFARGYLASRGRMRNNSIILGVGVKDDEQAMTERARLKATGADPNMFSFVVAPHMFQKYVLADAIKNGKRPPETLFVPKNPIAGHHG
jgi:hypothetical protein